MKAEFIRFEASKPIAITGLPESPIGRRIFDQVVFQWSTATIDDLAPHDQSITREQVWFVLWCLVLNNFIEVYEEDLIDAMHGVVRQVHLQELAVQFDIHNMRSFYDEHIQPHINSDFELHEVLGGFI